MDSACAPAATTARRSGGRHREGSIGRQQTAQAGHTSGPSRHNLRSATARSGCIPTNRRPTGENRPRSAATARRHARSQRPADLVPGHQRAQRVPQRAHRAQVVFGGNLFLEIANHGDRRLPHALATQFPQRRPLQAFDQLLRDAELRSRATSSLVPPEPRPGQRRGTRHRLKLCVGNHLAAAIRTGRRQPQAHVDREARQTG